MIGQAEEVVEDEVDHIRVVERLEDPLQVRQDSDGRAAVNVGGLEEGRIAVVARVSGVSQDERGSTGRGALTAAAAGK
jgi:hypothetical protein